MASGVIDKNTSGWLDVIRALSAEAVVFGHVNMLFFNGRVDPDESGLAAGLRGVVTFVGSYPHQAVMAFFVMSGYLVGGRALHAIRANGFDVGSYLVDRGCRLWAALIPAVVLTAALDRFSFNLGAGHHLFAAGRLPSWWLETNPWSFTTFISNISFLQMISSFQFGSNTALWSISSEFWYYMLFPCLVIIVYRRGPIRWLSFIISIFIILMFIFSSSYRDESRAMFFIYYFFVWSSGALIFPISGPARRLAGWGAIVLSSVLIYIYGCKVDFFGDFVVAVLMCGLILISRDIGVGFFAKPAKFIANYSYSLYVIHFPILIFLISFDPDMSNPVPFTPSASIRAVLYFIVINVVAALFGHVFERRTPLIKAFVRRRLKMIPRGGKPSSSSEALSARDS